MDDLGPILFAHAAQAWANIGHALGNALGDDNIGPGSDRVRKQYWAKFGATRVLFARSSSKTIHKTRFGASIFFSAHDAKMVLFVNRCSNQVLGVDVGGYVLYYLNALFGLVLVQLQSENWSVSFLRMHGNVLNS